jgi:SHAQKYF class myb-like DNA-binding protein
MSSPGKKTGRLKTCSKCGGEGHNVRTCLRSNDDCCAVCRRGGNLLCCDGCCLSFHLLCVGYQEAFRTTVDSINPWYCWNCSKEKGKSFVFDDSPLDTESIPATVYIATDSSMEYYRLYSVKSRRDTDFEAAVQMRDDSCTDQKSENFAINDSRIWKGDPSKLMQVTDASDSSPAKYVPTFHLCRAAIPELEVQAADTLAQMNARLPKGTGLKSSDANPMTVIRRYVSSLARSVHAKPNEDGTLSVELRSIFPIPSAIPESIRSIISEVCEKLAYNKLLHRMERFSDTQLFRYNTFGPTHLIAREIEVLQSDKMLESDAVAYKKHLVAQEQWEVLARLFSPGQEKSSALGADDGYLRFSASRKDARKSLEYLQGMQAFLGEEDRARGDSNLDNNHSVRERDEADEGMKAKKAKKAIKRIPVTDLTPNKDQLQWSGQWTPVLVDRFMLAIKILGLRNASPAKILGLMNVDGMTRTHVASFLQRYRIRLKRLGGYKPGDEVPVEKLQELQELHQMVASPSLKSGETPTRFAHALEKVGCSKCRYTGCQACRGRTMTSLKTSQEQQDEDVVPGTED